MIYELTKCKVCGSEDLVQTDKEIVGLDTYIVYRCKSCDSIVSKERPRKTVIKEENNTSKPVFSGVEISPAELYEKNHKTLYSINSVLENEDRSCGTAFAIGSNGYLLTNAHVVTRVSSEEDGEVNFEINDDITATSFNGEIADCELIDLDLVLDLALLKINKRNNYSVKLGSYETVKTGEKVVSIGNSKGEGMSITEGLVSDRARNLGNQTKILISVPINHGNSGGPLFNMKGQVIGVVASGKKNAVAMSYAIPVDEVLKFIKRIEVDQEIKVLN